MQDNCPYAQEAAGKLSPSALEQSADLIFERVALEVREHSATLDFVDENAAAGDVPNEISASTSDVELSCKQLPSPFGRKEAQIDSRRCQQPLLGSLSINELGSRNQWRASYSPSQLDRADLTVS